MAVPDETLKQIVAQLPAAGGASVLDIGCGCGALAAALTAAGYRVTGIDPQAQSIAQALAACPAATFRTARAEALPFADASFGAAVFLNTLHHVPEAAMDDALAEAWRCLRLGGVLIVVEPLAHGSFFEVMRPVEDETGVRHAAQGALDRLRSGCPEAQIRRRVYDRDSTFADATAFTDYLLTADPTRAKRVAQRAQEVATLFRHLGRPVRDGTVLTQPHDLRAFRKPQDPAGRTPLA